MKYIVWVKDCGVWVEQGDGALTMKQAERISKEIRHDCGVAAIVRPIGVDPTRRNDRREEMSKHTPGPWKAEETRDAGKRPVIEIVGAGRSVADLLIAGPNASHDSDGGTGRADAALIAAAPDLLAALEALYALVQGESPSLLEDDHHDEMIRAAIAKATGV